MLQFLRKHQRILFIVVTAAIVVSFTFFGAYNSFGFESGAPDKEIGKTLIGKSMKQREVTLLSHLIATTATDQSRSPNLLNDGVIARDFLKTGFAHLLVADHFPKLKGEFEQRLKRAKSYRPYVHPAASVVTAQSIWQQVMPGLASHLTSLQKTSEATEETFTHLAELYVGQSMLPPELLKRILLSQEKQYAKGQIDPNLPYADLTLFGFHSAEDWFGRPFLDLISQTIINGAELAAQQGFSVSNQEVKASLLRNIAQGLKAHGAEESNAPAFFAESLRSLGVDEQTLLGSWKRVLLFRAYFEQAGKSVALDPVSARTFAAFANESAEVELYQLPDALRLKDFRSMLKLQCYLDAVSGKRSSLALPTELLSIERIEKSAPELVFREYHLEYKEVSKQELTQRVSLQQTWDFELSDQNWPLFEKEFPELAAADAKTRDQRFAALEKCSSEQRLKIDEMARRALVDAHPEKFVQALDLVPPREATLNLRKKGGSFPFADEATRGQLLALLEAAPVGELSKELSAYSPDGKRMFSIRVLKRAPKKELLSFAAASRDGTLDALLDQRLEQAYPDARKKDPAPFKQGEQGWKPFQLVRDEIGKIAFADLLRAIEESVGHTGSAPSLDFYAPRRLLTTMKEAHANPQDLALFNPESQWHLVKTNTTLKRGTSAACPPEELFAHKDGSFSRLFTPAHGDLSFFKMLKHNQTAPATAEIASVSELLALDVRLALMKQLVTQMREKQAISTIHYE